MSWDMQNRLTRRAAFVTNPQSKCPIALGDSGFWMDSNNGVVKFRNVGGTDVGQLGDSYLHVNADPGAGSDSNPGTLTQPIAHIEIAAALAPLARTKNRVVLHGGTAHTFFNPDALISSPLGNQSSPMNASNHAEGLVIVGGFTNEVGTRSVTANSAGGTAITDSTLSMTTDQYAPPTPAWVRFLTGASAGQRRMIYANNATTLTPNVPFSAISIGDTFVIERDAQTVTWLGEMLFLSAAVNMIGVKWVAPTTPIAGYDGSCVFSSGASVFAEACTFDMVNNTLWSVLNGGFFSAGSGNGVTFMGINNTDPIFNTALRQPAGCALLNARFSMVQGLIEGFWAFSNIDSFSSPISFGACMFLASMAAKQWTFQANLGAQIRINPPSSALPGYVHGGHPNGGSNALMTVFSQATVRLDLMDMSNNAGGDAVQAVENGLLDLQRVTGSGNAGKGVNCINGGKAFLRTSGGNIQASVTGSAGDTAAGAVIKPYSSINGTAGYAETSLLGPTGNAITVQNGSSLTEYVKGTATLVGGTFPVTGVPLSTSAVIELTVNTPGGTLGHLSAPAASRVPGSSGSFVINSDSVLDTSTVDWRVSN